jgi:hypothetical protein
VEKRASSRSVATDSTRTYSMHTHARTHTHAHACTRARAHTHTHTPLACSRTCACTEAQGNAPQGSRPRPRTRMPRPRRRARTPRPADHPRGPPPAWKAAVFATVFHDCISRLYFARSPVCPSISVFLHGAIPGRTPPGGRRRRSAVRAPDAHRPVDAAGAHHPEPGRRRQAVH